MRGRFRDHQNIVFFTGAGMSAESGVPTYRGKGGVWKEYDYEKCACQAAFQRDPEYVWEFHNYRRQLVSRCKPNRGHELIARAETRIEHLTVVTQNIDGLHQLAGSQRVWELHGSLWETRCDACGARELERAVLDEVRCACGAFKRPNIVWFGDVLFQGVVDAAAEAIASCDLFVAIGTSAVVYPAAQLPVLAKRSGARLLEINPEATPLSDLYDECFRGTATETLEVLFESPS